LLGQLFLLHGLQSVLLGAAFGKFDGPRFIVEVVKVTVIVFFGMPTTTTTTAAAAGIERRRQGQA
jgi:hypothetical protein